MNHGAASRRDPNKDERDGRHAALETFLVLNGREIEASIDEQERVMFDLAAGRLSRDELASWLREHVRSIS